MMLQFKKGMLPANHSACGLTPRPHDLQLTGSSVYGFSKEYWRVAFIWGV